MSTIFHEGRKLLRQKIGNANYAEIADFLYFRENISQYADKDSNRFFLLPNIEYLANEIGFGKTLVSNALSKLEEKDFIKKIKHKCYDGAVRLRIYITSKFKDIMHQIALLRVTDESVIEQYKGDQDDALSDSPQNDFSDSPQKQLSIIKEHDLERKNNNMLEPVTFDLDLNKESIEEIADSQSIDPTCLFMNILALQELNLFKQNDLLAMAIDLCKVNDKCIDAVSTDIHYSKLYELVELERGEILTPTQHLYLSALLNYVEQKVDYFHKPEIYQWAEFQLTNPDHHYQGRDFRHCCNIIKKALLSGNKKAFCRPKGLKLVA